MKKLLLCSVSVMAFASAAVQATELQVLNQPADLVAAAQELIDLNHEQPLISPVVREQALTMLAEESQAVLGDSLLAMNKDSEKKSKPGSSRSE